MNYFAIITDPERVTYVGPFNSRGLAQAYAKGIARDGEATTFEVGEIESPPEFWRMRREST